MIRGKCFLYGVVIIAAGILAGCGHKWDGPELHKVSGVVLMDGEPLANAVITFTPKSGGKFGSGITNSSGKYYLECAYNRAGVPAAEYLVSISTLRLADPDTKTAASPETVPAVYNSESQLSVTVPDDRSKYQFKLDSKAGPVVQPST